MEKTRYHFLPVFVMKNPAAAVFPTERAVYYPWFTDRCGEHWAIVNDGENRIIEGGECLLRGDDLNDLTPALLMVGLRQGEEKGVVLAVLGDLDGKYIVRKIEDLFHMSAGEATEKLRDAEWVQRTFGLPKDKPANPYGPLAVDSRDGLLKQYKPQLPF